MYFVYEGGLSDSGVSGHEQKLHHARAGAFERSEEASDFLFSSVEFLGDLKGVCDIAFPRGEMRYIAFGLEFVPAL